VDEVVFAVGDLNLERLEQTFADCERAGVTTRILLNCFPQRPSRVEVDELDGVPMLAFRSAPHVRAELLAKRLFDLAGSAGLLLATAPLLLVVAAVIRATSDGPALFVQRRVGLNGREFDLYKFRSMVADAEARKGELLPHNEMSGPAFKIANDPRITPIGRLLRRTSLDELPQLLNVLRGDMSLVGPRPAVPMEVHGYARWQRRRLSVKPGITCLWQISGRNDVDFDTWMKLDLSYIDNWSLWLDLKIILYTIPAVLLARGAR
jgi:exopolysaccharide biosynthesis polyprenyl glycosylphosphotransferase